MAKQSLRIASYNVENLFARPRAMNKSEDVAARVLHAHARVNELIEHPDYTASDKQEMLQLLDELGLLLSDGDPGSKSVMAVLRRYRGQLLRRPRGGTKRDVTVAASGRDDWVGWVDLVTEDVNARAIENTARVITEVGADIVGVVEAENRVTLKRFSERLLVDGSGSPLYPHVMVIDGNDDRGIDVGMLSAMAYPIERITSHVDDGPYGARIFSRDCPEYWFRFPAGTALAGEHLVVLVNHFKSKYGGNDPTSVARRTAQAARAAEIYQYLRNDGIENIAVVGDFNDTPDSEPLQPLLAGTDLTDFAEITPFDDGAPGSDRPGTLGNGTKSQKIDFLMLSPALRARATGAGIFRMGVWGGKNGTLFPHFDTLTKPSESASDHAAVYVDISLV